MLFTMTLASSDLQLVGGKFARLRDPTVSIMFEPDSLRAYCWFESSSCQKSADSK